MYLCLSLERKQYQNDVGRTFSTHARAKITYDVSVGIHAEGHGFKCLPTEGRTDV